MKLHHYTFNNAEREDIYLCDKHDSIPWGMSVGQVIDVDPKGDIQCDKCSLEFLQSTWMYNKFIQLD